MTCATVHAPPRRYPCTMLQGAATLRLGLACAFHPPRHWQPMLSPLVSVTSCNVSREDRASMATRPSTSSLSGATRTRARRRQMSVATCACGCGRGWPTLAIRGRAYGLLSRATNTMARAAPCSGLWPMTTGVCHPSCTLPARPHLSGSQHAPRRPHTSTYACRSDTHTYSCRSDTHTHILAAQPPFSRPPRSPPRSPRYR